MSALLNVAGLNACKMRRPLIRRDFCDRQVVCCVTTKAAMFTFAHQQLIVWPTVFGIGVGVNVAQI